MAHKFFKQSGGSVRVWCMLSKTVWHGELNKTHDLTCEEWSSMIVSSVYVIWRVGVGALFPSA